MTVASKQNLHDLIERLPDNEIATVYRLLASLVADPLWIASAVAEQDDEPYTPEQQASDIQAQAAIDRGEGAAHDDLLREFGLK